MRTTLERCSDPREDTYSVLSSYEPGTRQDLEMRLGLVMRPDLPIVNVVSGVPQLRRADLGDFYRDHATVLSGVTPPQARRGRTRRTPFEVAEDPYMVDLEHRRRVQGDGDAMDVLGWCEELFQEALADWCEGVAS